MNDMTTSDVGLNFISNWEGCILHVYKDVAGYPTIGIGHLIVAGETFPATITKEQAIDLLRVDIKKTEKQVNSLVKVSLNQNQFDALVSFTFNTGSGALATGSLGKLLNAGNYQGAAQEMMKWCHCRDPKTGQQVVNQGLLNRRKSEVALFQNPVDTASVELTEQEKENILANVGANLQINLENYVAIGLREKEDL